MQTRLAYRDSNSLGVARCTQAMTCAAGKSCGWARKRASRFLDSGAVWFIALLGSCGTMNRIARTRARMLKLSDGT
jgi:hypothetical protein